MKNIKNFELFQESDDNLEEFEAGLDNDEKVEVEVYDDLSAAIENLNDVLNKYSAFEEGEENADDEHVDLVEHDEREMEIIEEMKSLVEELMELKSELLGEEIAQDEDEVEQELVESKKHPGFKKVASDISKREGISKERASAILASSTRKSSDSAKRKNSRLKRVK
jgi:hypothetical protein